MKKRLFAVLMLCLCPFFVFAGCGEVESVFNTQATQEDEASFISMIRKNYNNFYYSVYGNDAKNMQTTIVDYEQTAEDKAKTAGTFSKYALSDAQYAVVNKDLDSIYYMNNIFQLITPVLSAYNDSEYLNAIFVDPENKATSEKFWVSAIADIFKNQTKDEDNKDIISYTNKSFVIYYGNKVTEGGVTKTTYQHRYNGLGYGNYGQKYLPLIVPTSITNNDNFSNYYNSGNPIDAQIDSLGNCLNYTISTTSVDGPKNISIKVKTGFYFPTDIKPVDSLSIKNLKIVVKGNEIIYVYDKNFEQKNNADYIPNFISKVVRITTDNVGSKTVEVYSGDYTTNPEGSQLLTSYKYIFSDTKTSVSNIIGDYEIGYNNLLSYIKLAFSPTGVSGTKTKVEYFNLAGDTLIVRLNRVVSGEATKSVDVYFPSDGSKVFLKHSELSSGETNTELSDSLNIDKGIRNIKPTTFAQSVKEDLNFTNPPIAVEITDGFKAGKTVSTCALVTYNN